MNKEAEDIPVSVRILREHGPLLLTELTRQTAIEMGWSVMYSDVDGVMHVAEERGLVRRTRIATDYRNTVWAAV